MTQLEGAQEALAGRVHPPDGLIRRLDFYGRRSGYLYASLSYLGRKSPRLWSLLGPIFTRGRIRRWLQQEGRRILNLGGGGNLFDRWLTADVDPRADVYVDITKPLPFSSGAVDVVYLEEVFEHVSRDQAQTLLRELFRILKPGGVIRLTTPDLDSFAERSGDTIQREMDINNIFYLHGHRHIYSRAGVQSCLRAAGYSLITPSGFRDQGARFGYFDTHPYRFAESSVELTQYWEAEKPGV